MTGLADPKVREMREQVDYLAAKQAKAFEDGVPGSHVVRLARANHYVFLSNEADVLRELRAFIASIRSEAKSPGVPAQPSSTAAPR